MLDRLHPPKEPRYIPGQSLLLLFLLFLVLLQSMFSKRLCALTTRTANSRTYLLQMLETFQERTVVRKHIGRFHLRRKD